MSITTLFWFRRDLRLADNPALVDASADGPVVGVFVIDPALWGPSGANRQAFLVGCLEAIDVSIGQHLVVRRGDPAEAITALAREIGAQRVVAAADYGPYGRRRDDAVAAALAAEGRHLDLIDSPYAVPPGTVLTGGGTPYKVFTPFFRAWKAAGWDGPVGRPEVDWVLPDDRGALPEPPATSARLPRAGERAAAELAEAFLADGVANYGDRRDLPAVEGTSRLSPHLKWGTIHPRQLLDRLGSSAGEETFRSELAWREFYADVLADRPDSARSAYRPEMAALQLDEGAEADRRFAAWAEGRTGYPIVDAGMRQLVSEGWMHNRVRMIVASFLCKDLHLDWTRGARFFMEHLVDGDLASNNHGWQWVAGTGTDASPYYRVFNPVTQSKKFDPAGDYIRRWIPEIGLLPDRSIHAPWTEKNGAPAAYPPPMIDHGEEREEALRRYGQLSERG